MKETEILAKDYRSGQYIRSTMEDGKIAGIMPTSSASEDVYIAPGLTDLQVNGYNGIDLNSEALTVSDIEAMTFSLLKSGVTSYFATIITNSKQAISTILKTIAEARKKSAIVKSCLKGIHLEGPFISPEDGPRGAHDSNYIVAPDWDIFCVWQKDSENHIKLITLSPEWPNSVGFIQNCVKSGVKVSIGHTNASPQQIREAVEAGASLSTHLGNGAHLMLPRHENYIWEQLAAEQLWLSFITDGFHLPDAMIKVFLKAKNPNCFLVSDTTSFAGLKPGVYTTHIGGKVSLSEDGRLSLHSNPALLAGAAKSLVGCINHLLEKSILPLAEAWNLASIKPKEYLYDEPVKPFIEGSPADLVIFSIENNKIKIEQTLKNGENML